jgi:hypothetical protein
MNLQFFHKVNIRVLSITIWNSLQIHLKYIVVFFFFKLLFLCVLLSYASNFIILFVKMFMWFKEESFFFWQRVVTMLLMLLCYRCQITSNALLLHYPYYLIVAMLLVFLVLLPCHALPCPYYHVINRASLPYYLTSMSFNFLLFRANINSLAFIFDTFKKVVAHSL